MKLGDFDTLDQLHKDLCEELAATARERVEATRREKALTDQCNALARALNLLRNEPESTGTPS